MPQILANISVNYSVSAVSFAFNTDLILIKANSDGGSTIYFYNNTAAPTLFETYISTDSISDLITASNGALVLGTVWQINSGSKYSSSVSYAFPTAGSQIRTSTGSTNINSEIIYRGNSYFVQETQSSLVASANVIPIVATSLVLTSPNGTTYTYTANNDGSLNVT